jgi:ankyrin repeat protein
MFIVPKRVKSYIYLMLLCCSVYLAKAMEQPTLNIEKKAEVKANPWTKLPKDIKKYIISFLESAKDRNEAVRNIMTLSLTSKEFHNLINDLSVLDNLIREISKRFNISPIHVAIALFSICNTLHWLETYIHRNPDEIRLLDRYLIKAAKDGNTKVTKFLLNAGVDITKGDKDCSTPLLWAASRGEKHIAELLLDAGADVNQATPHGTTSLHLAANKGMVELLLQRGADVNKANKEGETPLYWSARNGHWDRVKLLLKHGANREELPCSIL